MPAGVAEKHIDYDGKDKNAFAVVVHGDSMAPKIENGDTIVIEPNKQIENGNIVFCRCPEKGGCTIKKYVKYDNQIVLRPLNPAHEEIVLTDKDNFKCYRVVEIRKKV